MSISEECILNGYEQTNFELITQSENYKLPVSSAANYSTLENIKINKYTNKLSNNDYILISPYKKQNYLSSKIFDVETNEFFHIKVIEDTIQIYPKNKNFSFEIFKRIIRFINNNIVNITPAY